MLALLAAMFPANAAPPVCGDGSCTGPETCSSCPGDCGACTPTCGDGSCNGAETCSSCPGDCGACPPGTTSTTTENEDNAQVPIKAVFKNPKGGDTIKRGILPIVVQGFEGNNLNPGIQITAESDIFGTISLVNNFENRGSGIYGANVVIGKDIGKGQYAIIVKAKKATYDEERILITFDPTIYFNASLDKKEYFKGERVNIIGSMAYFGQQPLRNSTAEISFSAKDFSLNKTIRSDNDGGFSDSYLISFAEPEGDWAIKFLAEDEAGNEGSADLLTNVSTPKGVAFYTVTFLSPLENAEFKRGNPVPITVEIKEEGKPVKNATVDFRNPTAEIITLQEITPGTYTAEYKIDVNDPLGPWYIAVQAVKTKEGVTRAGGTKIPVTIRTASLNLALIKPRTADFFTGLQTEIIAELRYPDGTRVEKADIFANIGDETVRLEEIESGTYSSFYLFTEKDVAATYLQLNASDIYGNSIALAPKAIGVEKIGERELKLRLFYYNVIVRYWYLFVSGIMLFIIITSPFWYYIHLKRSLKKTEQEEKRIIYMEEETQRKYFKQHSITVEDYNKLMLKYRERLSDLKEKELRLRNRLASFAKKKIKRIKK